MGSWQKFEDGQKQMGIRLPMALYEELQARAIVSGVPIAEQFRRSLRLWFDSNPIVGVKPGRNALVTRTRAATFVSLKPSKSVPKKRTRRTKKRAVKR